MRAAIYEAAVFASFLAAMAFVQGRDQQDKEVTAREVVEHLPLFSMPLDYDISVEQSGPGISEPKTRYYQRKEQVWL